jgi:hypothetical protein
LSLGINVTNPQDIDIDTREGDLSKKIEEKPAGLTSPHDGEVQSKPFGISGKLLGYFFHKSRFGGDVGSCKTECGE